MVAFGHTAVGTIVGVASYKLLGQSDIALGLIGAGSGGIISHYLMDLMPHGHFFRGDRDFNKYINWVIMFDVLIPILFLLILSHFLNKSPIGILYILFAIGGAQLPDIIMGLRRLNLLPDIKIIRTEYNFHVSTHWHGKFDKALLFSVKDIWQVLMFLLAILILIKL